MREESKIFLEQSKKDIEAAKKNIKIKEYYVSAFLCQQSAEKALKALYIEKRAESPGQTHSLIYLAKETKVPKKYFQILSDLTPEFITTRYPDAAGETPYKLYHKDKVEKYINELEELLKWIENQVKKQ
ncbi:MAG: HEPN domain-containing protein [Candidatus Pacearchaeota archaeon]